jgi:DNA anti-recombination protein RmuC
MKENLNAKSIEQLLAEADELAKRFDGDAAKNLKEEHRRQVEKHAQQLKRIKAEVQGKSGKKETSKIDHGAEGVHAAIQEISKAMGELAKYLT